MIGFLPSGNFHFTTDATVVSAYTLILKALVLKVKYLLAEVVDEL